MLVHYGVDAVKGLWSRGGLAELFLALGHFRAGVVSDVAARLGVEADITLDDEQQIHGLFDAGDRALMNADIEALGRIFADDYVQYDAAGRAFTKQEVLKNLGSGTVRYPVIVSTGRRIRLFGEFAIVHGSESDEVEADGERFLYGRRVHAERALADRGVAVGEGRRLKAMPNAR
jgi:uncharacterized protein DUF4440